MARTDARRRWCISCVSPAAPDPVSDLSHIPATCSAMGGGLESPCKCGGRLWQGGGKVSARGAGCTARGWAVSAAPPPSPFGFPAFRAFFVAKLGSTLAQIMMVVVIGWQVYDLARASMPIREAAFLLGLVGLYSHSFAPWLQPPPQEGSVRHR